MSINNKLPLGWLLPGGGSILPRGSVLIIYPIRIEKSRDSAQMGKTTCPKTQIRLDYILWAMTHPLLSSIMMI